MSRTNTPETVAENYELKFQQDIERILYALQTPLTPTRSRSAQKHNINDMEITPKETRPKFHIRCTLCEANFSSTKDFEAHSLEVHRTNRPYTCANCDKTYTTKGNLDVHIRRIHKKETNYQCTYCDKAFFGKGECRKHIDGHKTNPDFKPRCFVRKEPDIVEHKCQYCNRRFAKSSNLKAHLTTIHDDARYARYICSYCNKKYYTKDQYELHYRTHTGLRPFKCTLCERSFTRGDHLRSHERIVHGIHKPFKCFKCSKRYSNHVKCQRHQKKCKK